MTLISDFREALTIEIEEQKKKGTARWEVRAGRLVETRGPLFVYSFALDDPTLAGGFDDTPVKVRTSSSDASGHIVGISGNQVFVAIESDLGDYIPSAHILAQPYYLLECLSERLSNLADAKCVISNKCLRRQSFRYQADTAFIPDGLVKSQWESLNEGQKTAIRQSLGSEVCYVWGPPGTGKTTTVGIAVACLIQQGRTVLLTANTNIATDHALKACMTFLKETDHYGEGRILRLGTPSPQIKDIAEDDNLDLDKIVERKSQPLREQLLKLREELTEAEKKRANLDSLKSSLERWNEIQTVMKQNTAKQNQIVSNRDSLTVHIAQISESITKEQDRYNRAKAMPPIMRFVRRMTLSRLENIVSELTKKRDMLLEASTQAEHELQEARTNLERLDREATQIERQFRRLATTPDELVNAISGMQARIDELRMQIAELERQIDAIRQDVINHAVLVATTFTRTYTMAEVYGRQFETIVCDEASMAPIPALFWACSLATKSVTVAGDFRQLSPIAESKDAKVKEWLRRHVFAAAGVDKDWETNTTAESPMVMLKTQYRMQSQIRDIISNVFYGNQLSDGNTISDKPRIRDSQPCPGVYTGLYDTSAIDPWCSWTSGYSRFNLYHAVLAVRLCQTAIANFGNIGIITPYKAQTRLIKVLVEMNPALRDKVVVSNVHRFQGNERELIIFDLVDSTGLPLGKLLKGRIDSEDIDNSEGARLINVACSRARYKLAIIANLSYLKAKINNDWSVSRVLNQICQLGTFPAEQLVPGYADPSVTQARAVMRPVNIADAPISSLWTEEEFHSGVYKDLEGAKEYAIIMSPFITRERLRTYADLFRAKVEKKVQLQVVTRPPHQQGTVEKTDIENMLNHLQEVGISVVQRRSMHQKVVVIDGRIVWFGSLNPLSHRNTQELMFRLESEDFTKQVMDECALQAPGDDSRVIPPAIDISKIPPRSCSNCGNRMKVTPKGRFGPFYKCDKDGSTASIKKEDINRAILPEAKICPKCGRVMELRRSKTGVFLGCSGFKDDSNQCKYTRSL
ncbi:hypothetical protein DRO69_09975 [Candidatus Bathyarchaeota archaeon]|nr:MAG: hypothetical protein DRI01_06455 [Chloroflexota bacterium]RLI42829.1 MAG: hypothetical protein DRO69_09975 [Candidatus Bathyarchaeota archaeon]